MSGRWGDAVTNTGMAANSVFRAAESIDDVARSLGPEDPRYNELRSLATQAHTAADLLRSVNARMGQIHDEMRRTVIE